MDKTDYLFSEITNNLLTSPISNKFTIKKPKIGVFKDLKNIKIDKIDGLKKNIENENRKIYTLEQCIELNNKNLNSYKSENPNNKLLYTDINNEEEKNKINTSINYDYLLNILQCDPTSIEGFIDGNNGKFIEEFKEEELNNDILFDSLFEEGNLRMAIDLNNPEIKEYDILMRKDYNNEKNYSWFYFYIKCKNEGNYKFNILNFIKKKIPYDNNSNVKVLVYNKNDKWTRNTYNIFYYPNTIPITPSNNINQNLSDEVDEKEDDNQNKENKENNNSNSTFYTLTFTYYVTKENINTPIFFSYCYPYTYTTLQDYLYSLSINNENKTKLRFSTLNNSISGNPLDIIYITNFSSPIKEIENRQNIIFTSRVHPGETVGSYVIESVINSLLDKKSSDLRNKYIFKIIPMLNPDGVINGHYRNNLLGKDLNRMWSDPRNTISPTILYAKQFLFINKALFYCDFHGHSKMPNCALYGCSPKKKKVNGKLVYVNKEFHKNYHFYEEKVFMKIFEEEAKYYEINGAKYTIAKSKLKTARAVAYNEFNISFSYAIETSIMNVSDKNYNGENVVYDAMSIDKLITIGNDYVNAFIKWDNKNKFYNVLKKIRNEEEEKKEKKEKEREEKKEKEREKEKEKEREKIRLKIKTKSLSLSPFNNNQSLSSRCRKSSKKHTISIMEDIGHLNINEDEVQKNCKTYTSPKKSSKNSDSDMEK